jgi:hypothetical protein
MQAVVRVPISNNSARFKALMTVSAKTAVFWVVAPCSDEQLISLMIEAAKTSETSINSYQTVQRNHPEDSHV